MTSSTVPPSGTATAPPAGGAASRWRGGPASARRFGAGVAGYAVDLARHARRAPVTIALVVALWVLAVATGSLPGGPDEGLMPQVGAGVPTLADQRWWTLLTAGLFAADLVTYLVVTVLLLVVGIAFEYRWGSLRMAVFSLVVQVVGTAVAVGAVALSSMLDWLWPQYLADLTAVGPTPLVAGLLMAYSAGLSAQWRRRIRVGVSAACLVLVLYGGQLQDILRSGAAVVGLLAGALALGAGPRVRQLRVSRREARVLVAVVVAATALGPLLVAVTGEQEGPLSALADLYVGQGTPKVGTGLVGVVDSMANFVMSVLPALLVLVLAAGLRRGRRFAWWSTLVFHVVLGVVGVLYAFDYYDWALAQPDYDEGFGWVAWLVPLGLIPLLVVVLLLLTRSAFGVRAPVGAYRKLALSVAGVLVTLWVLFVLIGALLAQEFTPEPTVVQLVLNFPIGLLPNGYLDIIDQGFTPVGNLALLVTDVAPVIAWGVVLVGLLRSFTAARIDSTVDDRARARTVLEQHGVTALSYLTTWEGNSYWFDAPAGAPTEPDAFVAYRVEGAVAITTGDPICPPERLAEVTRRFVDHCAAQGWTPCLYSTTEAVREVTDTFGWASLQVAEETVLPLGTVAFAGKKFQDIRTSISRAGKAGIVGEWVRYPDAPLSIRDQIQAISEEWVSDKALPEMGFTLGGLDELDDPAVRVLVAVDADRTVHGVTSWMPCYRDGVPVGWTLDFMRRRAEGFKGVMEFLIGTAALDLQKEGAEFLSLSGAPLAQANPDPEQQGVQRLLQVLGKTMEPVYGFRSLLRFKAKFQPAYRPLYLCYPEAAVLPRIGLGITHAYLPDMTMRQTVRMMGQLT